LESIRFAFAALVSAQKTPLTIVLKALLSGNLLHASSCLLGVELPAPWLLAPLLLLAPFGVLLGGGGEDTTTADVDTHPLKIPQTIKIPLVHIHIKRYIK
jgi:hypothetical protein